MYQIVPFYAIGNTIVLLTARAHISVYVSRDQADWKRSLLSCVLAGCCAGGLIYAAGTVIIRAYPAQPAAISNSLLMLGSYWFLWIPFSARAFVVSLLIARKRTAWIVPVSVGVFLFHALSTALYLRISKAPFPAGSILLNAVAHFIAATCLVCFLVRSRVVAHETNWNISFFFESLRQSVSAWAEPVAYEIAQMIVIGLLLSLGANFVAGRALVTQWLRAVIAWEFASSVGVQFQAASDPSQLRKEIIQRICIGLFGTLLLLTFICLITFKFGVWNGYSATIVSAVEKTLVWSFALESFRTLNIMFGHFLRGVGLPARVGGITVLCSFCVGVPLILLCVGFFRLGYDGVLLGLTAEEAIKSTTLGVITRRMIAAPKPLALIRSEALRVGE